MFFMATLKEKFTYLTSKASSISELELSFAIKYFIESKKLHILGGGGPTMEHETLFHI